VGKFFDVPTHFAYNQAMKILIVEDDEKVANFLKENLIRDGYELKHISSFDEFEHFLRMPEFKPELIILDRLLGNSDSKTLIKLLKNNLPQSRILCLSALNSPNEKAALLDSGVDDYLGKPFSLVELQARVRSLLRRSETRTENFYFPVGDLIIDLRSRTALKDGQKINLKHKEFTLLLLLAQNLNRVFSKYQLLDSIWETNLDIESNVLEVTIMNLRKKLEDAHSVVNIQSKRNVGYWLEA
jgi:DNA-binding response OmpR family regulator